MHSRLTLSKPRLRYFRDTPLSINAGYFSTSYKGVKAEVMSGSRFPSTCPIRWCTGPEAVPRRFHSPDKSRSRSSKSLTKATTGRLLFEGFFFRWLGATRANDPPPCLFAVLYLPFGLHFATRIRNGMVKCAAPAQSPKLLLSRKYRVTSASGSDPVAKKRVPPLPR